MDRDKKFAGDAFRVTLNRITLLVAAGDCVLALSRAYTFAIKKKWFRYLKVQDGSQYIDVRIRKMRSHEITEAGLRTGEIKELS